MLSQIQVPPGSLAGVGDASQVQKHNPVVLQQDIDVARLLRLDHGEHQSLETVRDISPRQTEHFPSPTCSIAAQVQIRGQTPVTLTSMSIPYLGPSELLVQLSHSGICATDVAIFSGKLGGADGITGFVNPHVGGHEGIGTIIAIGSAAEDGDAQEYGSAGGFQIGQRVGVRWTSKTCEQCTYCHNGRGDLCAFQRVTSVHEHGTFQQFCKVHSGSAIRIPELVTAGNAAAMMCAGSAAYMAVKV